MTSFEIIILIIIYMICYGYMLAAICLKEKNVWLRIYLAVMCLALAVYAPMMIGGMLYEKMGKE